MTTKIKQWGNSLAVRLPKEIVKKAGIKNNQRVLIRTRESGVFIEPILKNAFTLDELLSKVTPENIHKCGYDFGEPRGNEVW